ncbi:Mn2+ homeostasis protein-like protein Per1 [Decorospora gaudefroyi]|uniref:Post-GPI attachment to proteins factor 3 n=1 Tax=Decorospora gaudefroyi TaxID=184978 RepID=A0A6A5KLP3_9PLEO|nr:Mn2+ homeostasis protein-like protein Per1 [Decorospora gaudefroyi]
MKIRLVWQKLALVWFLCLSDVARASLGDRLPEFKLCVEICKQTNCSPSNPTPIPLHRRLLLWNCGSECDYTCQHITTHARQTRDPPYLTPVPQYHGKWPFYRFLGLQEPFSVLFSLLNYWAHAWGLTQVRERIPRSYGMRPYYIVFAYVGMTSWVASMVFHARDFKITERVDYFAAAANVLYGLFYAPIRVWRLDHRPGTPRKRSLRRVWTVLCALLYLLHVGYLSLWRWDYTYNMAANVGVGVVANVLWTGFSVVQYRRIGRTWAVWPGVCVAWIVMAMGLELLDFAPWGGMVDAHCLWHLGTVVPTVLWYNFLVRDAQEDIAGTRLKD